MMHLKTKNELLHWLVGHTKDSEIRKAFNHGTVTLHGLFKGGWVVEAVKGSIRVVVGIRPTGVRGDLICGRLSSVPWFDYKGGTAPLDAGDRPDKAKLMKRLSFKGRTDPDEEPRKNT